MTEKWKKDHGSKTCMSLAIIIQTGPTNQYKANCNESVAQLKLSWLLKVD